MCEHRLRSRAIVVAAASCCAAISLSLAFSGCAEAALNLPPPDYVAPKWMQEARKAGIPEGAIREGAGLVRDAIGKVASAAKGSSAAKSFDYYYRIKPAAGNSPATSPAAKAISVLGGIGELAHAQLAAVPSDLRVPLAQVTSRDVLAHVLQGNDLASFDAFGDGWIPVERARKLYTRAPIPAAFNPAATTAVVDFTDPGFGNQTFFYDPYGPNMNLMPAWAQGITGKNVTIAVVDDGLDTENPDLVGNYYANSSYDFNNRVSSPDPKDPMDRHGTSCAGLVAATANTTCGVGVAYGARVAGIRLIGGPITAVDEATALNYGFQENDVYSNSWGPADDGMTVSGPSSLTQYALMNGVTNGRAGRGNVYVFASGNGGYNSDHCGYDGYATNLWSVAVGAIDSSDKQAPFGERCAAMLVSTYGVGTFTTAVDAQCAINFSGTSAAAPIVSGMVGLLLQARPELTWRDVHDVLRKAAVPVHLANSGAKWATLPWGLQYSESYGYGKVDAARAVDVAVNYHTLLGAMATRSFPNVTVNAPLAYGTPVASTLVLGGAGAATPANPFKIERIAVAVWIACSRRGDLDIRLTSPAGVTSYLAEPRPFDNSTAGLQGWIFTSVKHWSEQASGNWTLTVQVAGLPLTTGTFVQWNMGVIGEAANSTQANIPPLPAYTYQSRGNGLLDGWTPLTLGVSVGSAIIILVGAALCIRSCRRSRRERHQFEMPESATKAGAGSKVYPVLSTASLA